MPCLRGKGWSITEPTHHLLILCLQLVSSSLEQVLLLLCHLTSLHSLPGLHADMIEQVLGSRLRSSSTEARHTHMEAQGLELHQRSSGCFQRCSIVTTASRSLQAENPAILLSCSHQWVLTADEVR